MRGRHLSIRVRITLGTVLLALIFASGFALYFYNSVGQLTNQSTLQLLKSDILPYELSILEDPEDDVDDAPAASQFITVINPAGAVNISTMPQTLEDQLGDFQKAQAGVHTLRSGSADFLILVEHLEFDQGRWTIVAARDQSTAQLAMAQLANGILLGVGAMVIVFGVVSWLLTGAALRPVERLRRAAKDLSDSSSDDLLPVSPVKDEVQQLATTLNELIVSLRTTAARERQMVSDVSHELRTPLAVLQGQLELLGQSDSNQTEQDVAVAVSAAQHLTQLVTEILQLSRLEALTVPQTATIPSLVEQAGHSIDRARLHSSSKLIEVNLEIDADPSEKRLVGLSETSFGSVLDNLLNNAIEAIEDEGTIVVRFATTPSSVVLTVADTGPGVPVDFLPRAFDRFSRADSARQGGGSGLGLAIVAAAAHSASGSATLVNQPDSGALLTITLPLLAP